MITKSGESVKTRLEDEQHRKNEKVKDPQKNPLKLFPGQKPLTHVHQTNRSSLNEVLFDEPDSDCKSKLYEVDWGR